MESIQLSMFVILLSLAFIFLYFWIKYHREANKLISSGNIMINGEYILCAAIWFDDGKEYAHQPKNIDSGLVFCGWMHGCIFAQIGGTVRERKALGIPEKEQGFLTSKNRFVNREEAAKIAIKSGQIKEVKYFKNKLDSSDLYKL